MRWVFFFCFWFFVFNLLPFPAAHYAVYYRFYILLVAKLMSHRTECSLIALSYIPPTNAFVLFFEVWNLQGFKAWITGNSLT